ncbi:hypothetical protein D3C72_1283530 [compost metagenome]
MRRTPSAPSAARPRPVHRAGSGRSPANVACNRTHRSPCGWRRCHGSSPSPSAAAGSCARVRRPSARCGRQTALRRDSGKVCCASGSAHWWPRTAHTCARCTAASCPAAAQASNRTHRPPRTSRRRASTACLHRPRAHWPPVRCTAGADRAVHPARPHTTSACPRGRRVRPAWCHIPAPAH